MGTTNIRSLAYQFIRKYAHTFILFGGKEVAVVYRRSHACYCLGTLSMVDAASAGSNDHVGALLGRKLFRVGVNLCPVWLLFAHIWRQRTSKNRSIWFMRPFVVNAYVPFPQRKNEGQFLIQIPRRMAPLDGRLWRTSPYDKHSFYVSAESTLLVVVQSYWRVHKNASLSWRKGTHGNRYTAQKVP
jgi:hypothetical protein